MELVRRGSYIKPSFIILILIKFPILKKLAETNKFYFYLKKLGLYCKILQNVFKMVIGIIEPHQCTNNDIVLKRKKLTKFFNFMLNNFSYELYS